MRSQTASKAIWKQWERIIKDHGAILVFSQLPVAIDMILPARNLYRYEYIWKKTQPVGHLNSGKMPLRGHENVLVFYKHLPKYHPQMMSGFEPYKTKPGGNQVGRVYRKPPGTRTGTDRSDGTRYMTDVITCAKDDWHAENCTKKPTPLCEYFIKVYTDENDVVLDPFMGVGTTGAACVRQKRSFIGIEMNKRFFNIADETITLELAKRNLRESQETQ